MMSRIAVVAAAPAQAASSTRALNRPPSRGVSLPAANPKSENGMSTRPAWKVSSPKPYPAWDRVWT
jgi:hypothetical protein